MRFDKLYRVKFEGLYHAIASWVSWDKKPCFLEQLQNTLPLWSTSFTCVGRLWRTRHNTMVAFLIQWHVILQNGWYLWNSSLRRQFSSECIFKVSNTRVCPNLGYLKWKKKMKGNFWGYPKNKLPLNYKSFCCNLLFCSKFDQIAECYR